MKIAIVGGGSFGLLWAFRMAQLDEECCLFTRTIEQRDEIKERGITLIRPDQKTKRVFVNAEVLSCSTAFYDIVLVMVKQRDLPTLIPLIKTLTHPHSQILFFQNGMGHEEKMQQLLERWTYGSISTEGAFRKNLVTVYHTGKGQLWIGPFVKKKWFHPVFELFLKKVENLKDVFVTKERTILRKMWEKLIINSVINPLAVVYGIRNGQVLSSIYEEMINLLVLEAVEVAKARGYLFSFDTMKKCMMDVCLQTKNNFSSMLQDIHRGYPTEIDYINGTIVRWGEEVGIKTPTHHMLYEHVIKIEKQGRKQ